MVGHAGRWRSVLGSWRRRHSSSPEAEIELIEARESKIAGEVISSQSGEGRADGKEVDSNSLESVQLSSSTVLRSQVPEHVGRAFERPVCT